MQGSKLFHLELESCPIHTRYSGSAGVSNNPLVSCDALRIGSQPRIVLSQKSRTESIELRLSLNKTLCELEINNLQYPQAAFLLSIPLMFGFARAWVCVLVRLFRSRQSLLIE